MKEIKRKKHPDRVSLSVESLLIIDNFISELSRNNKGVKVCRKSIVEWLVEKKLTALCELDIQGIAEAFYDEERFLKDVITSYKRLKANDEELSLEELIKKYRPRTSSKKRGRKKKVSLKNKGPHSVPDSQLKIKENSSEQESSSS